MRRTTWDRVFSASESLSSSKFKLFATKFFEAVRTFMIVSYVVEEEEEEGIVSSQLACVNLHDYIYAISTVKIILTLILKKPRLNLLKDHQEFLYDCCIGIYKNYIHNWIY